VGNGTLDIRDLVAEFDPEYRIVHQTGKREMFFETIPQAELLANATDKNLSRLLGNERGYLITDITKIVIDPAVVELFADRINALIGKYLHPHGIARYGYAIGRVTVRMGHEAHGLEDLNLFGSHEEAFAYIKEMEIRRRELEAVLVKAR
jgi:hypothetical protein